MDVTLAGPALRLGRFELYATKSNGQRRYRSENCRRRAVGLSEFDDDRIPLLETGKHPIWLGAGEPEDSLGLVAREHRSAQRQPLHELVLHACQVLRLVDEDE